MEVAIFKAYRGDIKLSYRDGIYLLSFKDKPEVNIFDNGRRNRKKEEKMKEFLEKYKDEISYFFHSENWRRLQIVKTDLYLHVHS